MTISSEAEQPETAPSNTTNAQTFAALGVPTPLVDVLAKDGKTTAFPIQADTLPDTLQGRDVLGRGKTGSGKTLAFGLPLVARLAARHADGRRKPGHPFALVLAPTRELATQIETVIAPLAQAYQLRTTTVFGGVKQQRQVNALRNGVDIVVACPGRLEDLKQQGFVSLDAIEITVLDEADHMADLGFLPSVTRILSATPDGGQRMLFSATLDNGIDKLAKRFLHNPILHSVDEANSPVAAMTHHVFEVASPESKKAVVRALASGTGRRILFMRTKHHAKRLAKQLTSSGIPAVDLQGNLSQHARERNLAQFENDDVNVLVATDVAARGIDVPAVELVVHVDPPAEHKAYLHRSGRTARAGHQGDVVTICLPEQRHDVRTLLRQAKIKVTPVSVTADSPEVIALVGDVAPYVKPVKTVVQQQPAKKRSGQSQRNGARQSNRHQSDRRQEQNNNRRGSHTDRSDRQAAPERSSERRQHVRAQRKSGPVAGSHQQREGQRQGTTSRPRNEQRSGGQQRSNHSKVGQLAGSRGKAGHYNGR